MPHRAAGWRIEPPVSVPIAHGASPAATAAALPPDDRPGRAAVPWVEHRPEAGVLVRGAHRELVLVGLAQQRRAGLGELLDHGRRVRRPVALEDPRARLARHAFGAEQVLDRQRHPAQRRPAPCRRRLVGDPRERVELIGAARRGRRRTARRGRALPRGRARPRGGPLESSASLRRRARAGNAEAASGRSGRPRGSPRGERRHGTSARSALRRRRRATSAHALEVELADLLDVVEHLRQLGGHALDLGVAQLQPREARDVQYLIAIEHRAVFILVSQARSEFGATESEPLGDGAQGRRSRGVADLREATRTAG